MRLDRFISNATPLSRAETQRAIRAGRVTVAGKLATNPSQHIPPNEAVTLDNQPVALPQPRYFMLNKPAGYVSATRDSLHPTVLDLLNGVQREGLHPVGRLDIDTTGLVLICDDGEWGHRVTAPRHECAKRYRVSLAAPLASSVIEQFTAGLLLKGEKKATRPAQLEAVTPQQVLLTIHEGKYHQVKRMFAAVGNHVTALHREAIGPIELDPSLPSGGYRPLKPEEIDAF